jgi:DNA polymerase-4
MTAPRVILHVDMDAFFASVEQRDDPSLRGKPVLVGGTSGRGVVTAASYEARKFGCRSAMPMAQAMRLCPQALVVKGRHGVYSAVSRQVMTILESFSPDVQPVSIDEAYLDCSGVLRHHATGQPDADGFGAGHRIAEQIRRRVRAELGLTCSVGVAGNKFVAKVASDLNKPDGLCVIRPEEARDVLGPLPIGVLRGVGPHAAEKFIALGIRTVAQLRDADAARLLSLSAQFGDQLDAWQRMCHGHDDRRVHAGEAQKSIGKEQTFRQDDGDMGRLLAVLMKQAEHVCRELREARLLCRTVTIKIRTGDFVTVTRSCTLDRPASSVADVFPVAERLLREWGAGNRVPGGGVLPLRLLGISLHQLTDQQQLDLFAAKADERHDKLDAVSDAIVAKFGSGAISRLRSLGAAKRDDSNKR